MMVTIQVFSRQQGCKQGERLLTTINSRRGAEERASFAGMRGKVGRDLLRVHLQEELTCLTEESPSSPEYTEIVQ